MVVAARVDQDERPTARGHRTGNRLLTGFVATVFGAAFTDILSGYRVFSRRFVKSFPVLSRGFEIETELTVHALELELAVAEIPTPYYARPEGSESKLSAPGATAFASSAPSSSSIARSGRWRSSRASASCSRSIVDRARDPDLRHISSSTGPCRGCRPRSSSTGMMLLGVRVDRCRPHPRYRDARAA